jgi:hypothetical protein
MFRFFLFTLASLLLGTGNVAAQNVNDIFGIVGGLVQSGIIQSTQAEWRKLSQSELQCVDKALLAHGNSLQNIIREGIQPVDSRMSDLRASCSALSDRTSVSKANPELSVYTVDGLPLGGEIQREGSAYKLFQCGLSRFDGFIWCQKVRSDTGAHGPFKVSVSILHSSDGKAVYVNQYIQPAYFSGDNISAEIGRLTKKFGQTPNVIHIVAQNGLPDATIASWGDITLDPLSDDDRVNIASGRRLKSGITVDFLGDFQKSAKLSLPIFKIAGGRGYIWSASSDRDGRGHLRILEADASQFSPADTSSFSSKTPTSGDFDKQSTAQLDAAKSTPDVPASIATRGTEESSKRRIVQETHQRTVAGEAAEQSIATAEAAKRSAEETAKNYLDAAAPTARAVDAPTARDASEIIRSPEWSRFSVEQKLGYFAEVFWLTNLRDPTRCGEGRGKDFFQRKECILNSGFHFFSSTEQRCTLKISERVPLPVGLETTWDGKVDKVVIIGRELTIPLTNILPDEIKKNLTSFTLAFDVTEKNPVTRRVLLSNNPDAWVEVPPPPKTKALGQEFYSQQMQWFTATRRFGDVDITGFSLVGILAPEARSDPEGRYFLSWTTPQFGWAFGTHGVIAEGDEKTADFMNGSFVETIKSLIKECKS